MVVALHSKQKGMKLLIILSVAAHLILFLLSSVKGTNVFMAQTVVTRNEFQSATDSNHHAKQDSLPQETTATIPLAELVTTDRNPMCDDLGNNKMTLLDSLILDESITHPPHRNIPKIIHFTSKTRCMPPSFIQNINTWRFDNYSLYIHDDAAVDRLLQKYWPEFPHLQLLQKCMISGAAKADLWRYLVLWEYGGIYTDIDNAPGPKFKNATIITDDTDSWFVVERMGIMSQYVMAATPKHPFMHIAVMHCLARLLDVAEIGTQYVPFVTGPGVIKTAMIFFMSSSKDPAKYQKVKAGHYVGEGNRSVTVVGTRVKPDSFIKRESIPSKRAGYKKMGMVHFSQVKHKELNISCYWHLYNEGIVEK